MAIAIHTHTTGGVAIFFDCGERKIIIRFYIGVDRSTKNLFTVVMKRRNIIENEIL